MNKKKNKRKKTDVKKKIVSLRSSIANRASSAKRLSSSFINKKKNIKGSFGKNKKISFLHFSIADQVFFAKRLSFLIHANVPIVDSLRIIQRQTSSKRKIKMYDQIIDDVANGQFLAKSLGKFNKIFGDFAINIIRTGEASGTLDESLNYLAEELQKKQQLRGKVFGALIYPALIVVATFGITGMLMVYIFPKILPIFASLNVDLPITTRMLMWLSDFLSNWGLWVIGGVLALIILIWWLVRVNENVHYSWDKIVLKTPLLGKIMLNYHMANINRTLGLLLKTDMGVVGSIAITAETTKSMLYRRKLADVSENVIHGEFISDQFAKWPKVFPDLVTQMVAIGERTGRLSDTFLYVSKLYEDDVERLTKNLSSTIEPVLMIIMGMMVGFIAISVITPIYEITTSLKR